ncbi:MAG: hypothetical protein ABIU54_13595 [Candidatus Eisenbacteria bacterium]
MILQSLLRRHALCTLLALVLGAPPAQAASKAERPTAKQDDPVKLETKLFKGLAFRSIGPANMGGRISDIAVNLKKPHTFYVGAATGGVFKTTNNGVTFSAIFEKEAVASIGALALWQRNPELVWAGTGEANSRNSSAWGRGVFRSEDGGASWKSSGLEATSTIARIVCDPADSNTVYVAALGRLWGENAERGVFKTSDGGRTWSHVLKVDSKTGAVDLVMDPSNPRVLYAAMYARRRTAWSYSGVSESGGIYKTTDGGHSWNKLTNGLPKRAGRIGLDVYAKNSQVVYAVLESDEGGRLDDFEEVSRKGGVFRSDDAGAHWKRLSPFSPRSFYFSQIRVQPDDSTRVYVCGTDLFVSDDGGATFHGRGARNVHPDNHALWIDPRDGDHVLIGNDGGVYASYDRASTWDYLNRIALGEFYTVTTDRREPFYHVYGGLQDNQTWGGPSRSTVELQTWSDDLADVGIRNEHWYVVGGGDGFHVQVDPTNPNVVYFESQGGYLARQDLVSGKERNLRPSHNEGEPTFRFNWNAPFAISPHDPTVLWLGGQYLFRLYDRGDKWERVSPDLTTKDREKMATGGSGAETHCTITALAESPKQAGVVWVGTDDGKIWVTPDGGKTWDDLTANVKGVPSGLYVSRIEASHHDARTAYLCIDGHRSNVFTPYLGVTRDMGRTWTSLAAGLAKDAPVHVVREGLRNPKLLFAGTEFGLFMSLDAGKQWLAMKDGLPTVAVHDVQIQPQQLDLCVATHGRSLYILDGIQMFEEWNAKSLTDTVSMFTPKTAWEFYERPWSGNDGQAYFSAKNPPQGAWLDYFCPREIEGGVSLAIRDSADKVVRTLTGEGTPGFHRVVWDLVAGEPKTRIGRPEWGSQPTYVRPGRFTVKLSAGKAKPIERVFQVKAVDGVQSDEL